LYTLNVTIKGKKIGDFLNANWCFRRMVREKKDEGEKTRQLVRSLPGLENVAHVVDRVFQRAPEIPLRWAPDIGLRIRLFKIRISI